jgi:hypothetical protein
LRERGITLLGVVLAIVSAGACGGSRTPAEAVDPRVGRRVHITGCENGELKTPLVNLWSSAARTSVVGKLSGDGRAEQGFGCQGAVVIIRAVDGTALQVETVSGDQVGWVSDRFIGRTFDTTRCTELFGYSATAARKCAP